MNISKLIEEIKEHILYMQELGIEEVEMPTEEIQPQAKQSEIIKPEISSKIQKQAATIFEETSFSALLLEEKKERNKFQEESRKQEASLFDLASLERSKGTENMKLSLFDDRNNQKLPIINETLEDVRKDIGDCKRCPLHKNRTQIVHSVGNPKAELMFVGEAPGADEDKQGEPFVGKAGKLLTKIIEAMRFKREDVFIGNINRCRPPENRMPTQEEAAICKEFLIREICIVRPKVIVLLGNTACQNLLDKKASITKIRGEFQEFYGIKVMPTFHPAYLLRDPSKKREVWEDMKKVMSYLNNET
jgi:DNA polymerase